MTVSRVWTSFCGLIVAIIFLNFRTPRPPHIYLAWPHRDGLPNRPGSAILSVPSDLSITAGVYLRVIYD